MARVVVDPLAGTSVSSVMSPETSDPDSSDQTPRLLREIRRARFQLPTAHRNLLDEIGAQETAIDDWPGGVEDLYRSIRETPPARESLAGAAAVWLDGLRMVAFNAGLFHEATVGLDDESREALVASVAWHEYGHALSLNRSTSHQRQGGERLLSLLPAGLRGSIDYPGGYRRSEVFDEVIATVYAVMVSRVRTYGYGAPDYLHPDVFDAFKEVIPWPPNH